MGFMILLAVLVLESIADALTTRWVLTHGGAEGNPVLRWAFAKVGFWPSIILGKSFVVAVFAFGFWKFGADESLVKILAGVCILYAGVLANNFHTVMQIRRGT